MRHSGMSSALVEPDGCQNTRLSPYLRARPRMLKKKLDRVS
jgi:hypothetical protein